MSIICASYLTVMVCLSPLEKPAVVHPLGDPDDRAPYKMIQTIGLSVGAAVAYIIVVLGLMFYCKKRRNAKRLQKGQEGEEPEMECLNGLNLLGVLLKWFKISAALLCSFWELHRRNYNILLCWWRHKTLLPLLTFIFFFVRLLNKLPFKIHHNV